MSLVFSKRLRVAFAPPRYLELPFSGIDISTSGIKAARLEESADGLTLARSIDERLPSGAFTDGEIVDRAAVMNVLAKVAAATLISTPNVALSESKSYLFETAVSGANMGEWRTANEQRPDGHGPFSPPRGGFVV